MIDNVHAAMARMASIRAAMGVDRAPVAPAPAAGGPTSEATLQAVFAQVLSQASAGGFMAPSASYGAPPLTPVAGAVRGGPPPGMEGYSNGQIPPGALVPVAGTDELLWAPAAAAFEHMRRDAAAQGVALPVSDGYRAHHDQVRLADELGLYDNGGLAAVPGTSQHGWGRAVDLDVDEAGVAWLRANAWKYGFVETVPREPWHWEFHPAG